MLNNKPAKQKVVRDNSKSVGSGPKNANTKAKKSQKVESGSWQVPAQRWLGERERERARTIIRSSIKQWDYLFLAIKYRGHGTGLAGCAGGLQLQYF